MENLSLYSPLSNVRIKITVKRLEGGLKLTYIVTLITGLILLGIIIDLGGVSGQHRLGFQYWKNPGALSGAGLEPNHVGLDRFLGIVSVIVQAGFSFQGMELVAIAASETENPRRNIAKAVRRVFYRIVIFYILGVFITGLLVPYNDPDLLQSSGNAAESPYVIAMTRAGIHGSYHIDCHPICGV